MNHTPTLFLIFLLTCVSVFADQVSIEDVKINVSVSNNVVTVRGPSGSSYSFNGGVNDSYVWTLPDFDWNVSSDIGCPDLIVQADAFKCSPSVNVTVPVPSVEVSLDSSEIDTKNKEDIAVIKEQVVGLKSDVNTIQVTLDDDNFFTKDVVDGVPLWVVLVVGLIIVAGWVYYKKDFGKKGEGVVEYIPSKSGVKHIEKVYHESQSPLPEIDNYKPKSVFKENYDKANFAVADRSFEKEAYHGEIEREALLAFKEAERLEQKRLVDLVVEKKAIEVELAKPPINKSTATKEEVEGLQKEVGALRAALNKVKG